MTGKIAKAARLTIDGKVYDLDLSKFMFDEACELEEQWGLDINEFSTALFSDRPKTRMLGAIVWLTQVRAAAAEQGVSFAVAAKAMPAAEFNFNLAGAQLEAVLDEPNPTRPASTRTPATRTTRATSGRSSAKIGTGSNASST